MGPRTQLARALLDKLHDQGGICGLCHRLIRRPLEQANLDHIVPRSLGGTSNPDNLQATHEWCNRIKGADNPVRSCLRCRKIVFTDKHEAEHTNQYHAARAAAKERRSAAKRARTRPAYYAQPFYPQRPMSKAAWRGERRR